MYLIRCDTDTETPLLQTIDFKIIINQRTYILQWDSATLS